MQRKKYVHGVANLGSRTAKEQNRIAIYAYIAWTIVTSWQLEMVNHFVGNVFIHNKSR